MTPLIERTIYVTDRFYDVVAPSKDRAIVVGYGGKILITENGGRNWTVVESGVDQALYSIYVHGDRAWIAGQDGLILHSTDGGKTWAPQQSNAEFTDTDGAKKRAYLFAVSGIDEQHLWAVGDRSTLVSTRDGGATWTYQKVKAPGDGTAEEELAAADPVLYDVRFVDPNRGWVVGEFGKIFYTEDGGATWTEQNRSLLEKSGYFDPLDLPSLFGLFVKDPQQVLAAGIEGHIARTTNGGVDWSYDPLDVGEIKMQDPLFDLEEFPDGSGWAVGAAGEIFRKEAGAASWKRANIGQDVLTWLRALDFSDQQHGWMVGGFGLIFRTTDGGKTWLPSQG
ncbi:MAG TPA: YCF48-related protein [Candidatus Limnocylindria bacterium]|nr:YCF48-related protein [Candidatus Limnocylindria bacterium]